MKKFVLPLLTLMLVLAPPALRADDPDDAYLSFYNVLKQADKLSTNGSPQEALIRYQQADIALRNLRKQYPDFNRQLIQYRAAYVDRRIDQLASSNRVAAGKSAVALPAPSEQRAPQGQLRSNPEAHGQPAPEAHLQSTPEAHPEPAANPAKPEK